MFVALSALSALASLAVTSVSAIPVAGNFTTPSNLTARQDDVSVEAVPGAPHFVLYADNWVTGGAPPVDQVKGWNVYALAFWLQSGPFDNAQAWAQLSDADQTAKKKAYAGAGKKIIVSAFGATDIPTAANPTEVANKLAAYVKNNKLDGVDVDYEDLDGFNSGSGKSEKWLIDFTKALRKKLPKGQYILTHAPLAPWFSPNKWGGGGYMRVHKEVGGMIDWYNVQFYNQGANEYTTCDGLINQSSGAWPKTAVTQIINSGVPAHKVVIGKPGTAADASNGFVAPATLAKCVSQAKGKGWNGGVMAWQFPHADAAWIKTVRGQAWPV